MTGNFKGQIRMPNHKIPKEAYQRLLDWYVLQVDDHTEIKSAYGIDFKDPDPVDDSTVALKDYLMPGEIYNVSDKEDLFLVNHILKMNMHASFHMQYFYGSLGERYIRVPPQEWVTLEHRFYIGYHKSGRPPAIIATTGAHKGKGVKGASRPI